MRKRLDALRNKTILSPEEKTMKHILMRNGFVRYMTDRWQIDMEGKITIFASTQDEMIHFTANFEVEEFNSKRKGFLTVPPTPIRNTLSSLEKIISKLENI